jgi:hypothetical protein
MPFSLGLHELAADDDEDEDEEEESLDVIQVEGVVKGVLAEKEEKEKEPRSLVSAGEGAERSSQYST